MIKDRPEWFSRLVILNTNNLPDGEVNPDRFNRKSDYQKFLIFDAAFLAFHSMIELFKTSFPFFLMFSLFNTKYSLKDLEGFQAPFKRKSDLVSSYKLLKHKLLIPTYLLCQQVFIKSS